MTVTGADKQRSARRPRRSASSACPTPTRPRASSTPTKSSGARSARRAGSSHESIASTDGGPGARPHAGCARRSAGAAERPRLAVFKSGRHIYAQVIDDGTGTTLAHASSLDAGPAKETAKGAIARRPPARSALSWPSARRRRASTKVVFDRGGYLYHGRVKALADAARAGRPGVLGMESQDVGGRTMSSNRGPRAPREREKERDAQGRS